MTHTGLFDYNVISAAGTDIGKRRTSNQDEVICCPEYGFFAVSDGMGGLRGGGETAEIIGTVLPGLIGQAYKELQKDPRPEYGAEFLDEQVRLLSDNLYETMNRGGRPAFGATLCGVWLIGGYGVFVNLGDSRGYLLGFYKKRIRQITQDHTVAAQLVANGELSPEEARRHTSNHLLSRFVGMPSPALPETFIKKLEIGDRILLCSDGLHDMLEDIRLPPLMRSSRSPGRVVDRLIHEANNAGGRDNISTVYIKVLPPDMGGGQVVK